MYIRTKDGAIYDLKSKEISSIEQKDCWVNIFYYDREKGQYLEWDDNGGRSMDTIYKTEILNQSENLEELCDQIVYNGYLYQNKITWDNCIVEDSFEELEEPITDEMIKDGIYGAVWTEWGLKYVSKMNENGDLELI